MSKTSMYLKLTFLLAVTLFSNYSYGQDASWICASKKTDIPNGYFAVEIATDLTACTFPKQKVLINKITAPAFWMCSFDNIGAPSEYVVAQESKVETCGCKAPTKDGNGQVYCFPTGPVGSLGWPEMLVKKLAQ